MSNAERKREIGKEVAALHNHFENRIKKTWQEKERIYDKYKSVLAARLEPWLAKPAQFMSPEDAAAYEALADEEKEFSHKIAMLVKEALDLLAHEPDAHWEKRPSGEPGSLAETNSRHYQSKLDDVYSLEINWYDYPEDDGQVQESFRESYSTEIVGSREVVTRKGIGGIGKKVEKQNFPINAIGVGEDDNGEFQPSPQLKQVFDEETASAFQDQLLELGKRLREQLG